MNWPRIPLPRFKARWMMVIPTLMLIFITLQTSLVLKSHADYSSYSQSPLSRDAYDAEFDSHKDNASDFHRDLVWCQTLRRPLIHLGIMSMASKNKTLRRSSLRSMYHVMLQQPVYLTDSDGTNLTFHVRDFVKVQFVVGRPADRKEEASLHFENHSYRDLVILNMKENMNNGKTYQYFKHTAETFNTLQHPQCQKFNLGASEKMNGFDFVAKGDDDAFIHLPNLVKYLLDIRQKADKGEILPYAYLGRPWRGSPEQTPVMAGMMYALSWNLTKWVSKSYIPWLLAKGDEDQQVSKWFNFPRLDITRIVNEHQWVDHPKCIHPYWRAQSYTDDLIVIHQVKKDELLFDTMNHYFPIQ